MPQPPSFATHFARGAKLSVQGYAAILLRRRLLLHGLFAVLRTLFVAAALSAAVYILLLVLRPLNIVFTYAYLVRRVSGVLLFFSQKLAPAHFRGLFWMALQEADVPTAARLEHLPLVRGLGYILVSHVLQLFCGAVAFAALLGSAPFWLPATSLIAATAAFVYATPLVLLGLIPLALLLTVLVASGALRLLVATLLAFSTLANLAPALAAAGLVSAAALGLVPWAVVDACVKLCCTWLVAGTLAQQSLAQYAARQDAAAWAKWTAPRAWLLAGFGLPGCLAVQYLGHPMAGLAALELTHGAAATLLAEELRREEEEKKKKAEEAPHEADEAEGASSRKKER